MLANNPGPFTGPGTNTWLLADDAGSVIIIDPGPRDDAHEQAIADRLGDRAAVGVLVTHTHTDHAPLANPLARNLQVPTLGYGPGPLFVPDLALRDGSEIPAGALTLAVVHTPGHADDHLCFRVGDVLFSGDHIIGGSSVMVESMGPYLDSLRKLQGIGLTRILPGHGDEVDDPETVIDWYIAHRLQRHEQVCQAVSDGAKSVMEVVEKVYKDVETSLYPLAARSVEAHLVLLAAEGRITLDEDHVVLEPPPTQ